MYLCLIPSSHLPKIQIPNFDKLVHFTFYLVLTILMYYGWQKQGAFTWLQHNSYIKIFIIACAYGFTIEVMQETLTTTRHFELLDEAANATGALVGCWLSVKLFKYATRLGL